MDVNIIGLDDRLRYVVPAVELQHTEQAFSLFAKIPADTPLTAGDSIGFLCVDGRFRLFEITQRDLVEPDGVWEIHATDKAVRELMDDAVEDVRAVGSSIRDYVGRIIQNTRFTLGTVSSTKAGTTNAYYVSAWAGLENASEVFGVNIIPYYEFSNGLVSARKIDISDALGKDRGRIFELGDDMSGIRVAYDDSNIKTALYGRGKGVEIEGDEDDMVSYGRRLTFADVVWSKADGDPVDKPAGQEWVGDPDALAAFGRDGRNRFGFAIFENETDAEKLLEETWEQLQKQSEPAISISASVVDTERMMNRAHEAVRLGDPVLIRIPRRHIDIHANVTAIVRDYIKPEATQLTIANAQAAEWGASAGRIMSLVQEQLANYSSKAAVWDRSNAFSIDGVMDVMNNQIISTSGNWYTDPDTGAIMLVSSDGTKAMRLTGAGWQIADGKTGDSWNWRTAATGSGIVADMITSGVLNTNLLNVTGSGTQLTGDKLEVAHPTLGANYKTVIDASGLRMLNGSTVLGGIVNLGGQYVSAVQQLHNPSSAAFRADVGAYSGIGESSVGLQMRFNNGIGGQIGAYSLDGSTVGGLFILNSTSSPLYIDARQTDVQFIINHNGEATFVSLDYLYTWIRQHDD